MSKFVITPATATKVQKRGPQNAGYSNDIISLLAQNCDRANPGLWLEHKLWVKDGNDYRELGIYHTHGGWQTDLTDEMKEFIDQALDAVSLETYLKWIAGTTMTRDLAHWAESGVTTARQLGDYLDGCVAREKQKGHYLG